MILGFKEDLESEWQMTCLWSEHSMKPNAYKPKVSKSGK